MASFFILALFIGAFAAKSNAFVVISSDEARGIKVVAKPWVVPVESKLLRVTPHPLRAKEDVAQSKKDGCMALGDVVVHPLCVYGDPNSNKTVVLFGDSRAQQYFAPIEKIAKERGLRLVVIVRGNCFPADVYGYERLCDTWKKNSLKRIIEKEKPKLTILGSATKKSYSISLSGKKLTRKQSQPYLVKGMIKTINSLKAAGSRILVIRDHTFAPANLSRCVLSNKNNLRACAFKPTKRKPLAFELEAAQKTRVSLLDPQSMFCSPSLCPAVLGGVLVYKDSYHITNSLATTFDDWFRSKIPSL